MSDAAAPELKVWEDARGRRRVSWPGRKGYPIMLRRDESPEDGYLRTLAADAARDAADQVAGSPPPPAAGPADEPAAAAPDAGRARPKGSDPKPKGGRPMGKPRPTDAELVSVLAELLTLPAIPMGLPVRDPEGDHYVNNPAGTGPDVLVPGYRPRCEFCRDHFLQQGPSTAQEVVKMAQQSPPLRTFLERVYTAWSTVTAAGVIAAYASKPMLHHLAPEPVLDGIGPVLGVPARPPRPPKQPRKHEHGPTPGPAAAAPGPAFA